MKEADYPALFTAADAIAKRAQHRYTRLVQIDLVLLIIAAVFGVLEALVAEEYAVAMSIASAISLAGALTLETYTRIFRLERRWFENRAIAESAKSAAWRFMMRIEPFDADGADRRLVDVLTETAGTGSGQPRLTILDLDREVTSRMREVRALPVQQRRRIFLDERVIDQAIWYAAKSKKNARSATMWFWIGIAARASALAFALLTIALPFKGSRFVELFAAVAAATTAWAELGRHEEQAKSYGNAANELTELEARIESAPDEDTLKLRVIDAEGAISREHTLWMVKRA